MLSFLKKDKSILSGVLFLGFVLNCSLMFETYREIKHHDLTTFQSESEDVESALGDKLKAADEALHNIAALFTISPAEVDSDGFRLMAETTLNQQSSVQSIAFARWVPEIQRKDFERLNSKASGLENFKIYQDGHFSEADFYLPVLFLEPLTPKTISRLGFDLWSNPKIRKELTQAIDSGQTIVTPSHQDSVGQGLLLNRAVYSGKNFPGTVDQRRKSLLGILRIWMNAEPLFASLPDESRFHVRLKAPNGGVLFEKGNSFDEMSFFDSKLTSTSNIQLSDSTNQIKIEKWIPFTLSRFLIYLVVFSLGTALSLLITLRVAGFLKQQDEMKERQIEIEQKVAEKTKALRESEMLLRQVIDSNPNLIYALDASHRLLFANRKFFELFCQKPIVVYGRPISFPLPGQNLVSVGTQEEQIAMPDGNFRWFETSKVPLALENNLTCSLVVAVDITQKKHNEAVIADQRAKMFSSAKLSSLGEMAGGIAHEINTPLTTIKLLAGQIALNAGNGPSNGAQMAKHAALIERTTDRIAKIIRGLRSFSRDGSLDQVSHFCLIETIEETLAFCREKFRNHGIKLISDFPTRAEIMGREVQISQVLLNLLNNAFDAVQGVPNAWIRIQVVDLGMRVQISIEDNGGGIPKSVQEKLFHPFFTTKEIGKGTGLGLSISRGIVESHFGNLSLDPESPHTRFIVDLPKMHLQTERAERTEQFIN